MSNKTGYIMLTAIFKREDDVWTAECKELGTATFGETLEEAKHDLMEAVAVHLNTLEDVGECKRFLKERGVKIYEHEPHTMRIPELPYTENTFVTQDIRPISIGAACS